MFQVSTCVEARFDIAGASFLSDAAKERLYQQEANRINKKGELVVTAQEERTQERNKIIVKEKIEDLVHSAMVEPKERNQWSEIGEITKLKRKEFKQHRKQIKTQRKIDRSEWN